jgi:hypothetical protein
MDKGFIRSLYVPSATMMPDSSPLAPSLLRRDITAVQVLYNIVGDSTVMLARLRGIFQQYNKDIIFLLPHLETGESGSGA